MAERADKDRRRRFTVTGRELRVDAPREGEKDWLEVGPGRYPPGTTFRSPVTGKEYPADDLRWDVTEEPQEEAEQEHP